LFYGSGGITGTNMNWTDACSQCQARSGGDLVVYESYAENSMVGGLRAAGLERVRGTRCSAMAASMPALDACRRCPFAPPCLTTQVEAYFQSGGHLGLSSPFYWIGATRQFSIANMLRKVSAGQRYMTVTGTRLPYVVPSNGPLEGPAFAPYAHWSAAMFGTNT
jgi:hypothetical protein